jgi:Xaa-Pro aminopeptidase
LLSVCNPIRPEIIRKIASIQKAIRDEDLDGWLFCNFHRRDPLSSAILERPAGLSNSRLWLYAVPVSGEPLALVHAIEADHLDGLPGQKIVYGGRDDLKASLRLLSGRRWGAHFSETISAVSFLDAGTAAFLEKAGLVLVPAEALVQRFRGILDGGGIASHKRAAAALYGIVKTVWDFVRSSYVAGRTVYEGDLRRIMEDEFIRLGLTRDHPPLAAAGVHSSNPHYDFEGRGVPLKEGNVVQLDLWAREAAAMSIYADISWVGVYARTIPAKLEHHFSRLAFVRDAAFTFIEAQLAAGKPLSGSETDAWTRKLLTEEGYGTALRHRTGHGIDTECHGSGVNIDSVEFPDSRLLLEGSCFSLEPGIYLEHYGMRTEIDVYIEGGKPYCSSPVQTALLSC